MTQSEYDKWRERSIREYIEENVKSGSAKEAATLAEKEFQQILPDGRATRDHFFFIIQDEATRRQVGSIWFQANRDQPAHPFCYLWDLLVCMRNIVAGALRAKQCMSWKWRVVEYRPMQCPTRLYPHNRHSQ